MVADLESTLQYLPQLLRLRVARVLNLQVPSLRHNLLCREGPLRISPPRVRPPLLYSRHLVEEQLLLQIGVHGRIGHLVGSHDVSVCKSSRVESCTIE